MREILTHVRTCYILLTCNGIVVGIIPVNNNILPQMYLK